MSAAGSRLDARGEAHGQLVRLGDVDAYRIDHLELMEPFLTTVVSDTDLWMFISSNGALTAGRVDADHAIFPYLTDDRLHRSAGHAGPVTIIARTTDAGRELWRPFDAICPPGCSRSITKGTLGNMLVFEEHNERWGLSFSATWTPSGTYGWARTVEITGDAPAELDVLDGLLDVMPAGVQAPTELTRSNLVDAYKRSETGPWGTAAIYSLESLVTDRAEPGEALAATVVWSTGFTSTTPLLDERAVYDVLTGAPPRATPLLTGLPGSYLLHGPVTVGAARPASWSIVADTDLDHAEVIDRLDDVSQPGIGWRLTADVEAGHQRLHALLLGADGFQRSADPIADAHHLSNVLFNSMRGGVFPYGYRIPVADFVDFLNVRNRSCHDRQVDELHALGAWAELDALHAVAAATGDSDLVRLVLEYLPLTFSRRHGDPSRPWNAFSIRVQDDVGGELLTYEGNWRDIFQNWEALLQSYPAYFPHVVAKFLNASTADGHNAYRISRNGTEWEVPDPDDPWSNIGYWGDHQIVYLLRLIEAWERFAPGSVDAWVDRRDFVYADVPYLIDEHADMVVDSRDTITYDSERAEAIAGREEQLGTDGRLVVTTNGDLARAGMFEKLLVPALAKLSAFVPGGGIWMNTQRPEWNDANNALAGNGLSMVTLAHLVRYVGFLRDLAARLDRRSVTVSPVVGRWLRDITEALRDHDTSGIDDDRRRRDLVDVLGSIGTEHRRLLAAGLDDAVEELTMDDVERFGTAALAHLDSTLQAAHRPDGLYHSYNRISFPTDEEAAVDHLGAMLEGQVAVLSSGTLDGRAALDLVEALFESDIYRPEQDSFMLYPERVRPAFLDGNSLTPNQVTRAPFLAAPLDDRWQPVFAVDRHGDLHFRPVFSDGLVLTRVLAEIEAAPAERAMVELLYEELFDHASFTGRSGAMYGYEGIGSIYWHMVAKLLLAVQEIHAAAADRGEPTDVVHGLAEAYRRIRNGLGFRKGPQRYGAFPTDCYSHTPAGAGAKQPGMTGQVKEEILARVGEIALRVENGTIRAAPSLIERDELFAGTPMSLTFCQAPVSVTPGPVDSVRIRWADGRDDLEEGTSVPAAVAREVFARSGAIERIEFTIAE